MLEKIADQGEAKEANLEAVPEAAKILVPRRRFRWGMGWEWVEGLRWTW